MGYHKEIQEAYKRKKPKKVPKIVTDALTLAERAHRNQKRQSGDPYIEHPVKIAVELIGAGWDPQTVAAGLCHDVLEDCDVTKTDLAKTLGKEVAEIVDGVTRLGNVRGTETSSDAFDMAKLFGYIAGDVRVLAVKLADRLHNMRTLQWLPEEKQQRKANETLEIFAPLAKRLGAETWATELEDLGFRFANKDKWEELENELAQTEQARKTLEKKAAGDLKTILKKAGIPTEVESRTKGRLSLWKKMQRDNKNATDIPDMIGVRVVVKNELSCYAALGVVHATYTPVPNTFKDYIAIPKKNGYQSLHTVVIDETGGVFEVQIRTREMDAVAKWGSAAHHAYKLGEVLVNTDPALTPEQFLEELKQELAQQQDVLVLTPKGNVKTLPAGSCGIDFAYSIHSEIGNTCVGVKINGKLRPIREHLQTGDVVEVITHKNAQPKRDWLDAVATNSARNKIRRHLTQQDRETNIERGKTALRHPLKTKGHDIKDVTDQLAAQLGLANVEELYRKVGDGSLQTHKVTGLFPQKEPPKTIPRKPESRKPEIPSLDGLQFTVARCCQPDGNDDIIGYVTVGRGVSVHKKECPNILALQENLGEHNEDRILHLAGKPFDTQIEIRAENRPGLLADVTDVFARLGVGITSSTTKTEKQRVTENFAFDPLGEEELHELFNQLKNVPSVVSVRKI